MSKSKQYERSYEANKSKDKSKNNFFLNKIIIIIYIMANHAQENQNESSKKIPTTINMSPVGIG